MSRLNPPPHNVPDMKDQAQKVFLNQLKESVRLMFQRMSNPNGFIIASHTPASASAFGTKGMIAFDSDYIYVCVSDNTWKRTALSTW